MYMGVILQTSGDIQTPWSAPHVYGGDPITSRIGVLGVKCSPCIWG